MYICEDIPVAYKYIAEINENHVILVNTNVIDSSHTYNAYIQFFNPSSDFQQISNYKPKFENATNITTYYDYVNNGYYNIYESARYDFNQRCYEVTRNYDFFSRPDYANIIYGVTSIVLLSAIVVNCVTSLVIKGGLFNNE